MKIVVVGGNGTIGKKVAARLSDKHEVLIAGSSSGDVTVDIANSESIETMLAQVGKVDAIVNVAGEAKWDKLDNLSEEDFYIGIKSKLMGQVNLVRLGMKHLNPGGSITLTTGILADDPVDMTSSAAMVNGGIHSFARAAALEIDNARLNVVSCGLVEDAVDRYQEFFPGHTPISMEQVVNAYVRSVEGRGHGEIIRVY